MSEPTQEEVALQQALERLSKWRSLFTGWQLGTRALGDPESDAVRDHREVTILLRAELNALVGLLIKAKVISDEDYVEALRESAEGLDASYEVRFPGAKSTDIGMQYDRRAIDWMSKWRM